MATIRRGVASDLQRIRAFYRTAGYAGTVQPDDEILLVEENHDVIGVVRLARENGVTVLRGMRVVPSHQRVGLGTRLLEAVSAALEDRPCYCIAYAHLLGFYARIGFREVDSANAPAFLVARLEDYRRQRPQDLRLLLRPGQAHPPVTGSSIASASPCQ